MSDVVIYVLEFDYVNSRKHADRFGSRWDQIVNAVSDCIKQEFSAFNPKAGGSFGGDSGCWFFSKPEDAVRAGVHLVDNIPIWSRNIGGPSLLARAIVYHTIWHETTNSYSYDINRTIGKIAISRENMPNDCLAMTDDVHHALNRNLGRLDQSFFWLPNHKKITIEWIGQCKTWLRPGRFRISDRKLEGAIISTFPSPVKRGRLKGQIIEDCTLPLDQEVKDSFGKINERQSTKRYIGKCFRVVGQLDTSNTVAILPLGKITYAHYFLLDHPEVEADIKHHIENQLASVNRYDNVDILGPMYLTPIGLTVAITTSDEIPQILMVKRSPHVYLSSNQWDVSFSGHPNNYDISEGGTFVDFWETAYREAYYELNHYSIERRKVEFYGIHLNMQTGAVDLLGHYKTQDRATELKAHLGYTNSAYRTTEPEMDDSKFAFVDATPSGIGKFCTDNDCVFGGRTSIRNTIIPEAAATIVLTLQRLGFTQCEIDTSLAPHCQQKI